MKILITGATGFIGRHFMARFSEHQYSVVCRDIARARSLLGRQHGYYSSVEQLPSDQHVDAVINLAGEPIVGRRWSNDQKNRLQLSRWNTTKALVDWIAKQEHKPSVLLSGSAIGIYGISEDEDFDETSAIACDDFASDLCHQWEQQAKLAESLCRVVLIRTGVVLGNDGGALHKMLLPFKLGLGGKVGSGLQWMSWIHIDDYLNALNHLLTKDTCRGPYNLTSPEPVKNERFVKALAGAIHRPCLFPMPGFVMRLALGESATLLLDGQRVLPNKLLGEQFTFRFVNVEAAMKDLFSP